MRAFLAVLKKELKRIFTDRRILSALFLPGILIYVIYSIMGNVMSEVSSTDDIHSFTISLVNEPLEFALFTKNNEIYTFELKEYNNEEEALSAIKNKELDAYVVYSPTFFEDMLSYKELSPEQRLLTPAPKIEIYYNTANDSSSLFYTYYSTLLNEYESTITNAFDINSGSKKYDQASNEELSAKILSMLLPMLLLVFLATGSMAICPDSIAGEKERGTIATLLITPAKRSSIALGKIIALSIASLSSALVSSIGLFLSLPKLLGSAGGFEITYAVSISTILPFVFVILSTSLLWAIIFTLISAVSKSVKEASSFSSIPMILIMLISILNILQNDVPKKLSYYLIPFYNTEQCINGLLVGSIPFSCIAITFITNIVLTVIGIIALSKIFNSEKIMFNK